MKIGITCYPTVGGSGAVAAELGKQLARRGHDIHFISYRLPFRLADFQENICFHEVDVSTYVLFEYPPYDLALAAKMAEAGREHHLDLFHVHYAIPHAIAGLLAQEMLGAHPPKLVTTLHGTDVTLVGQDRSFFEITKFGIERSDGVTAVSEFLRRMTVEEFQIKKPVIETIPNFVDLQAYSPERAHKEAAPLAGPGQKVLMHASNFRPVKRITDVIRIFERVARESDAVLLMVGEGPERSAAQALARRLGLPIACGSWASTRTSPSWWRGPTCSCSRPSSSRSASPPWRRRPRGCPWWAPTPGVCRRWSSTPRRAISCRWATWRAWPRAPSRS